MVERTALNHALSLSLEAGVVRAAWLDPVNFQTVFRWLHRVGALATGRVCHLAVAAEGGRGAGLGLVGGHAKSARP